MFTSYFRKKENCSKTVTKTLYWNKILVSECIFKLICHCENCRRSEICYAQGIWLTHLWTDCCFCSSKKSSYQRCSIEKCVLKNFAIFTEKHVLKSLFNKVAWLRACNFLKKRLQPRCFQNNIYFKCKQLILYLHVILFIMNEDTANKA